MNENFKLLVCDLLLLKGESTRPISYNTDSLSLKFDKTYK